MPVFNLMIVMHALDPILSVRLLELGVDKQWVGTAFTTIYLSNLVSSPIAGKMGDQISFAWVQRLGCIATCLSMFLIGPSHLLPLSVELMFIGFGVIGVSCSLVFVPCVPQIIKACTKDLERQWKDEFKTSIDASEKIREKVESNS